MLYTCTDAFYTPGNMVLAVAGNITRAQVLAALDRAGLPAGGERGGKLRQPEPEEIVRPRGELEMAVSQPVLGIGFKERPRDAGERLRWEVLADLLGELLIGDTTPLYRRLYDEGLVNSGFSSDVFSGEGYFCILFSGETREPETVRAALLQEIGRLRAQGIADEDFQLCRNALYGEAVSGFESPGGRGRRSGRLRAAGRAALCRAGGPGGPDGGGRARRPERAAAGGAQRHRGAAASGGALAGGAGCCGINPGHRERKSEAFNFYG